MIWLLWAITAWWAVAAVFALLNALLLPRLSEAGTGEPLPSMTVVIPARDEERAIGRAVEAHCTQDYPGLQVVVVDDGSTDATPRILSRLQRRFACLTVVPGAPPPTGWLGKPHAQMEGLKAARGELILFADADVVYAPGVHRRAAGEMTRGSLDMLLILSHLEGRGLEPLVLSFLDSFSFYCWPTFLGNVPSLKWAAFGAGSGNLVRREALEAAGGMERIKGEVVDDIAMGRMMKGLRGRFRLVLAYGDVKVRMYEGFMGCIEGFTKNYYAAFRFNPMLALTGVGLYGLLHVVPPLALAAALVMPSASGLLLPSVLAAAAQLLLNGWACRFSRQPLWVAPLAPVRALVWGGILARSMARYYRRGVVWRGRVYGR